MALNLFGNGYGNQNYSPAQKSGPVTNLVNKYGKSELKRTITTTSSGKPRTVTKTRTIEQPKMEYLTYQGSEETEATIPTKAIFGTTPQQRKQYVREIEEYNRQVRAEKKKVEDYNKEVKEWNEKGRFQTVRETYTYTPTTTKISTLTIPTKQSEQQLKETTTKSVVSKTPFERLSVISPQPNYLEKKEDKPTLTSELKSQASQRYLTNPKYVITGFKKFGEAFSKKDVTIVSEPLSKSVSSLKRSPGVIQEKAESIGENIRQTIYKTHPFRKDYVSGLYGETRAFREELKTPQRQAELILTGGELAVSYGLYKATTPKVIQKPTIKASTKIIETPAKLKPITSDEFVSITKYKTTTPEIQSTWFGLKKTPVTYSGEVLSYTPKVSTVTKSGNLFTKMGVTQEKLTTSLKYLESPIKSDLPAVISKPPKINILKDNTFFASGKETITNVPTTYQDVVPVFQASKGKITYTIGKKSITENIDDLGLLITKQKTQIFGQDLPTGVQRFQSVDIFKNQKSDIIQIDPALVQGSLVKSDEGFKFFKTKPSPTQELKNFYLGKTDTANIYGFSYTPKDWILKGTKSKATFKALPESQAILSQTSETFRLYPPALPTPTASVVQPSSVFTLPTTSKLERILNYKMFQDKSKPLTTLTPEKTSTDYFTTLGAGLNQRQLFRIKSQLDKKIEPTLKIETGTGLVQEMKIAQVTKSTPKLEFKTEPKLEAKLKFESKTKPQLTNISAIRTQVSTKSRLAMLPITRQSSRTLQDQKQRTSNISKSINLIRGNQAKNQRTIITSLQKRSQVQKQAQATSTTTAQEQDKILRQEQKPNIPTFPILTVKTFGKFKPLILPKTLPKEQEIITSEPAYDVLIKVGNKWVNRTNGKRNVYSAIHRGTELVDNTTAKSFKIKKGTGKANILKYDMPYNINKFYTPSKTRSAKLTGAYIEKSKFAIDTPGERKGLSVAKYLRGVKLI